MNSVSSMGESEEAEAIEQERELDTNEAVEAVEEAEEQESETETEEESEERMSERVEDREGERESGAKKTKKVGAK